MKKIYLIAFFVVLSFPALAQKVEFSGKPTLVHALDETRNLNPEEQKEYRVSIIEKDGKYFWASRQNKEMSKNISGVITVYSALDGSGTVIYTNNSAMAACITKEVCFNYSENIRAGIEYLSYYGTGE